MFTTNKLTELELSQLKALEQKVADKKKLSSKEQFMMQLFKIYKEGGECVYEIR